MINTVVIVVEGGVVQDVYCPDGIDYEVIDYDDLEESLSRDNATMYAQRVLRSYGYGEGGAA